MTAVAVGALPDGTPVIVSGGGDDGTVRVWRLADGTPVGEPLRGHTGAVSGGGGGGAAGRHPGHRQRRRRRHGAGVAAGRRHPGRGAAAPATTGAVTAVAVGALPDGTPVIVSGGGDGTVRVWRLADGTPLVPPLDLSEPVRVSPFTATSSSLRPGPTSPSTSQRSRDPCASCCPIPGTTTGRRATG